MNDSEKCIMGYEEELHAHLLGWIKRLPLPQRLS